MLTAFDRCKLLSLNLLWICQGPWKLAFQLCPFMHTQDRRELIYLIYFACHDDKAHLWCEQFTQHTRCLTSLLSRQWPNNMLAHTHSIIGKFNKKPNVEFSVLFSEAKTRKVKVPRHLFNFGQYLARFEENKICRQRQTLGRSVVWIKNSHMLFGITHSATSDSLRQISTHELRCLSFTDWLGK